MTQKAATQNLDDFAQWANEYVLPCLTDNVSDQKSDQVAILIKEFEKSSNQKITECEIRNLLPHRDERHVYLTKIVNIWRNLVPTPVNSIHCKDAEEWIVKRIFPILSIESFSKNEALEIVHKLKRKKREDGWVVTPDTLILTVTKKDLINMGLEFSEIKKRIELVESYMAA